MAADPSVGLLARAVENNVALYAAVLRPHGIAGAHDADCWWTDRDVPPYYSSLVTRRPGASEALLERIAALSRTRGRTIKDAFACLDLDWRVLFDACWYGRAPGELGEPETGATFGRVADAAGLARFEAAWQESSPAPGVRIFRDALLDDGSIDVYVTDGGGAILNRSEGAIGISNVFPGDPALHRDVARLAARLHPDRAVVGYGAHEDLAPLGFEVLGPLRVWIRD